MPQYWLKRAPNLDKYVKKLHQQPLLHVLAFLSEPEHHYRFVDLGKSIFLGAVPLNTEQSSKMLGRTSKVPARPLSCISLDCKRQFKDRFACVSHILEHDEFAELSSHEIEARLAEQLFPPTAASVAPLAPAGAPGARATLDHALNPPAKRHAVDE
jgi:hypothetical protein